MRKITLFIASLFLTIGAMAQTFVEPVEGRLYKIKGDSKSHPWVTDETNRSGNVVVSANEADAAVFEKTANGLKAVSTGKYLGYSNGKYTYSANPITVELVNTGSQANDDGKYAIKSNGNWMYNNHNNTDWTKIVHESSEWLVIDRFWGFIEVSKSYTRLEAFNADRTNAKVYAVKSTRSPLYFNTTHNELAGYWTASDQAPKGDQANPNETAQQFAFLRTDNTPSGKYYMYSVAGNCFITEKGKKSEAPVACISFKDVADKDNANHQGLKIYVGNSGDNVVNVTWWSNNAAGGLRYNTNEENDAGNVYELIASYEEFDLSAAMNLINGYENPYTLTVTDAGWATLYLGYPATIPALTGDDAGAYIVTGVKQGGWLALKKVDGVLPANTGVLVKANSGEYTFTYSAGEQANVEGNLLRGSVVDTQVDAAAWVLGYSVQKPTEVVFAPVVMNNGYWKNNAYKAYLPNETGAAMSTSLRFDFGTTAIEEVEVENAEAEVIYDLCGRRVNEITKAGVYIIGGRKVLVK